MRPRPLDRRQRYCPDCLDLDPGRSATVLCPRCGGTWAKPGYCPTCERYWSIPEGTDCPKHGLPLIAEPELIVSPGWSANEPVKWVTVGTYPHPFAAQAALLRLDAEGIPTFLDGARMGEHSIYQNATGGVKLQVPQSLQADARVLLAQSWDAPTASDEDDDDDDDENGEGEPIPPSAIGQDDAPTSLCEPIVLVSVGLALLTAAAAIWSWSIFR